MAQPTGQVLVNSGHALAGTLFAYATPTGMWDATHGAMLTKVGTRASAVVGGANVVASNSDTYFTLPSSIVLGTGAFTICLRGRMTATDARSIFTGNHSATTSYIWLNSSGQARLQGTSIGANGGVTTLATWHIVREGAYLPARVYKDGVLQGTIANSQGTAFTLTAILKGISGGTANDFHGVAELFHVFAGVALTQEQITSLAADPYQMLQAPADNTAPSLSGASATALSGTTATGGITTTEAGPAWAVFTTSSTKPTAAQIKAGQDHAGAAAAAADTGTLVVGANASAFGFTGLTPGATYYLHVTQDDTATPTPNTATPITSASITMPAPDVTPPALSAPSAAATGTTTATGSVTTNEATGLLHYLASTDNTLLDTDDSGFWLAAHSTQAVTAVGAQAVSWTGLTPNTSYTIYFGHEDAAGNLSPVLKVESAFSTDALPSGTITISSPVPYQTAQRNVAANTASVTIAGTSTATTAIEYRRGAGAWQTLVASHAGGAYSVAVTMPTGQGDLQVRHASDNAVTASVPLATVGDKHILMGQSNDVGVSPEIVPPVASAFTALQFDRADVWKPLQEGDTQATSFDGGSAASKGSYVGALSNRLQAQGIPVAFAPSAQGSTRIDQWQRYDPAPTDPYFNYGRALGQWQQMGGGRSAILWIGESDATAGTPVANYKAGMHALINAWWADTGTPVFLVMITNFHANAPAIRAAQLEIAAENPHVAGIADGGGAYSGDVHYLTAAQINAVADAIYTPFVQAFYTPTVSATVSLARSVRSFVTGTQGAARSIRAFVGANATASRSVRGHAVANASIARSIQAAGFATASIGLARSVRGHVSGAATVARSIAAATVVTASLGLSRSVRGYSSATRQVSRSISSGYVSATFVISRSIEGNTPPLTDAELRDLYARVQALQGALIRVESYSMVAAAAVV